jgi:hypothetical protein
MRAGQIGPSPGGGEEQGDVLPKANKPGAVRRPREGGLSGLLMFGGGERKLVMGLREDDGTTRGTGWNPSQRFP